MCQAYHTLYKYPGAPLFPSLPTVSCKRSGTLTFLNTNICEPLSWLSLQLLPFPWPQAGWAISKGWRYEDGSYFNLLLLEFLSRLTLLNYPCSDLVYTLMRPGLIFKQVSLQSSHLHNTLGYLTNLVGIRQRTLNSFSGIRSANLLASSAASSSANRGKI